MDQRLKAIHTMFTRWQLITSKEKLRTQDMSDKLKKQNIWERGKIIKENIHSWFI
jgi:hypothetical protein